MSSAGYLRVAISWGDGEKPTVLFALPLLDFSLFEVGEAAGCPRILLMVCAPNAYGPWGYLRILSRLNWVQKANMVHISHVI